MSDFIEQIGRYIDGALQDDIHTRDVEFTRVPGSGREVNGGFACDFDVTLQGQQTRITVSVEAAQGGGG